MPKKYKLEYGFYSDCQKEAYEKFGFVQDLPILKKIGPYQKAAKLYKKGKVLDVGAGKEKPLQKNLKLPDNLYFSLDTDPHGKFTYQSVDEIPKNQKFSFIFANQVLEHIALNECLYLVKKLARHLERDGIMFVTVPNANHPVRQRVDITHLAPWEYKALYMLYKFAGLTVSQIYRYSKRSPKGIIGKLLAYYINRIYRIDWCDSIMIIGKKL